MIEKMFREFCLACFVDISQEQFAELRRTFYGGASALYFLLMNVMDPGDEPTEGDMQKMRSIRDEIMAFNEDVKAGRA